MPASRPAWNGYLKLSFVSCPIALYPATSVAERLAFRQVNRRTGHRLKHKLVDAVTGEDVAPSDKVRGYETGADDFLLVEDRDIERARAERPPPGAVELAAPSPLSPRESPPIAPEGAHANQEDESAAADDHGEAQEEIAPVVRPRNTRTIEIERFVPVDQLDGRYFEKAYYIVPRGDISQEAFAVIRDAMAREKVAGLARVILSSRERPILVEPMGRGLRGIALRFAQDVRPEQDYFEAIPSLKLPSEMMKLAQHIIRTRKVDFDPAMLEDHYRTALVRILRNKQSKRAAPVPAAVPSRQNVIDLRDALRRSIASQDAPKKSRTGRRVSEKRRTRELKRKVRGS